MDNRQLVLLSDCVKICGEHYTVSNGFATKVFGEIQVRYSDLLTVELVRQRSKKMMYVVLLLGGVLLFMQSLDIIIATATMIALTALIIIIGAFYLVSKRQFVELTSMSGIYRIAVEREDSEIKNVVAQLQSRIFPNA